jgi:hypothetical protein
MSAEICRRGAADKRRKAIAPASFFLDVLNSAAATVGHDGDEDKPIGDGEVTARSEQEWLAVSTFPPFPPFSRTSRRLPLILSSETSPNERTKNCKCLLPIRAQTAV